MQHWWMVKTAWLETLVLADNAVTARRKALAFWAELGGNYTDADIVSCEQHQE